MTDGRTAPVALVGAYERENFGDILFLLLTRQYLSDFRTVATAPIARDATDYLPEEVKSYVPLFQQGAVRAVWVVGGEVGGTSVYDAYRMSVGAHVEGTSRLFGVAERDRFLLEETGLQWSESPYLPRASAFAGTSAAPTIINSVGVSAIERLRWDRRETVLSVLRDADYLAVRDEGSAGILSRLKISHTLAPDLVHTLAVSERPTDPVRGDVRVALVQLKERVLADYGIERFAEVIARSQALSGWHIRFFSAGSAPGHDSMELYRQVAAELRRINPTRHVDLSEALDPMEKVREIASADLWIGTSLHGLIVSTAFGVPRVGLALSKLQSYARTWGESMPIALNIDDLDVAADSALAQAGPALLLRARELGRLADENVKRAVEVASDISGSSLRRANREVEARRIERNRRSLVRRVAHVARALK